MMRKVPEAPSRQVLPDDHIHDEHVPHQPHHTHDGVKRGDDGDDDGGRVFLGVGGLLASALRHRSRVPITDGAQVGAQGADVGQLGEVIERR